MAVIIVNFIWKYHRSKDCGDAEMRWSNSLWRTEGAENSATDSTTSTPEIILSRGRRWSKLVTVLSAVTQWWGWAELVKMTLWIQLRRTITSSTTSDLSSGKWCNLGSILENKKSNKKFVMCVATAKNLILGGPVSFEHLLTLLHWNILRMIWRTIQHFPIRPTLHQALIRNKFKLTDFGLIDSPHSQHRQHPAAIPEHQLR